ncbi:hypothetical protein BpHYR1_038678 [Brachionus plicatilis]|uniref:Uncharacterized protein n=1 Tax=Brachionus plicatilis TaxID=10195 RepID=A0A3M7T3J7_BRAPC|nr:hypothetical protein BpHYR1_038678 [Brachionus plicatilis]
MLMFTYYLTPNPNPKPGLRPGPGLIISNTSFEMMIYTTLQKMDKINLGKLNAGYVKSKNFDLIILSIKN